MIFKHLWGKVVTYPWPRVRTMNMCLAITPQDHVFMLLFVAKRVAMQPSRGVTVIGWFSATSAAILVMMRIVDGCLRPLIRYVVHYFHHTPQLTMMLHHYKQRQQSVNHATHPSVPSPKIERSAVSVRQHRMIGNWVLFLNKHRHYGSWRQRHKQGGVICFHNKQSVVRCSWMC